MMAYNCHTVMNAIHQAGCHPVFIDADKSLRMDMDDLRQKAKMHKIDVIIVTHLFGIPNDIDAIRDIVNVPIIEDCAHAFHSPGCGKSGDFAIYSIGQGKFPSIGDGGICVINNEQYLEQIRNSYSNVPHYSKRERISLFCRMTFKHLCYRPWVYSIVRNFKDKKSQSVIEEIRIRRMDKGISTMFNHSLLEIEIEKDKQQDNASRLINILSNLDAEPLIDSRATNCFMLPIECKDVRAIREFFSSKSIETATHFGNCIEWAKSFGYKNRECPNSEYLTKHLLVIPTY